MAGREKNFFLLEGGFCNRKSKVEADRQEQDEKLNHLAKGLNLLQPCNHKRHGDNGCSIPVCSTFKALQLSAMAPSARQKRNNKLMDSCVHLLSCACARCCQPPPPIPTYSQCDFRDKKSELQAEA
eukprot:1161416-Pelagomonas_calceolata.AAC.3